MALQLYTLCGKFSRDGVKFGHQVFSDANQRAALEVDANAQNMEIPAHGDVFQRATTRLHVTDGNGFDPEDNDVGTCVRLSPRWAMTAGHMFGEEQRGENTPKCNRSVLTRETTQVSLIGRQEVQLMTRSFLSQIVQSENIAVYEGRSVYCANDLMLVSSRVLDQLETGDAMAFLVPFLGGMDDLHNAPAFCYHFGDPSDLPHEDADLTPILTKIFQKMYPNENAGNGEVIATWKQECMNGWNAVNECGPPFFSCGHTFTDSPVPVEEIVSPESIEEKDPDGDARVLIHSDYRQWNVVTTDMFVCHGASGCAFGLIDPASGAQTFESSEGDLVWEYAEMAGYCLGAREKFEKNVCGWVGSTTFVLVYCIFVMYDWAHYLHLSFPFDPVDNYPQSGFLRHLLEFVRVHAVTITQNTRTGQELIDERGKIARAAVSEGLNQHWGRVISYALQHMPSASATGVIGADRFAGDQAY